MEQYVPPGWKKTERNGRVVFLTHESPPVVIQNKAHLQAFRDKKRYLEDCFNPDLMCFTKPPKKKIKIHKEEKIYAIEIPEDDSAVRQKGMTKKVKDTGDTEEAKLVEATKLLYCGPSDTPDHEASMVEAVKKIEEVKINLKNCKVEFNVEAMKEKISIARCAEEICSAVWEVEGARRYLEVLSHSSALGSLLDFVRVVGNPLQEPVPDRKKSSYARLVLFGIKNCPEVVRFLINIICSGRVTSSDNVVTVGFYLSSFAHLASRVNSTMVKVQSLLLKKEGLVGEGLDRLSKVGMTVTDKCMRDYRTLLADLGETHFQAQVKDGMAYQVTVDNLDKAGHHLTQPFAELERRDTRGLDESPLPLADIPALFDFEQIDLTSEKNKKLFKHFLLRAGAAVGRRLAVETDTARPLLKHLPTHYQHITSHLPKAPAITIIKSTAYCQETKNSEWVEWCYGEQWEFLLSVSEAVEDKAGFVADIMLEKAAMESDSLETEEEVEAREAAEARTKQSVKWFGVWIGHGDALTFKMFWMSAKALTQGGVTALERLDYLEIFRVQLLHLKMNKVTETG